MSGIAIFRQILMIMVSFLVVFVIGWWGALSLLPVVLPVTHDTHIVLAIPISHESINLYFFALSTVDHRIQAAQIPLSLEVVVHGKQQTLASWISTASDVSPVARQSELSLALGLPLDEVVWLTPEQAALMTNLHAPLSPQTGRDWWWQVARLAGDTQHWSWWAFAHRTNDDRFEVEDAQHLATTQAWQSYRQKVSRASAFVQCPIAVVNTTAKRGLATELTTILDTAKMHVVRISDVSTVAEQSRVLVDPDAIECFDQARLVAKLSPLNNKIEQDEAIPRQYRAKIVWLVGADIAN